MGTQFHLAGVHPREESGSQGRAAVLIVPEPLVANALDLQGSSLHDRPFARTKTHLCTPENSYQAGQNVGGDEHVEDIVPARGGNQPGQQRPQGRTCAEHSVREGPPTRGPNLPAHPRAAFREVCPRQGSGLSCQGPKAGVADLWTPCRR